MAVNPKSIIQGLVVLLIIYEILVNGYAVLLPSATAITIVGINFSFIILIGTIIVVLGILIELSKINSWK